MWKHVEWRAFAKPLWSSITQLCRPDPHSYGTYGEGVGSRTGPESCAGRREASGEALTGVRVGRPLSRESVYEVQGADAVQAAEGNMEFRGQFPFLAQLECPGVRR